MIKKEEEKRKAIAMRKRGKTYSEILSVVHVAKSTLTLWLHDVGMAKYQQQRLTQAKIDGQKKGALARRTQRITRQADIIGLASKEIGTLSKRELFLIGTALYWAEGSKQKEHNVSQQLVFANSDANMVQCFLNWLEIISVSKDDIYFELYAHKGDDIDRIAQFWSNKVYVSVSVLKQRLYLKKGNPKTPRKNVGEQYVGLIRVRVKKSADLNRKVQGWVQGILKNWTI
jgi:hypothetical protein